MDVDEEALIMSENQKHSSDTKMFERIVNRLKARFKARICFQEIINQLSKFLFNMTRKNFDQS